MPSSRGGWILYGLLAMLFFAVTLGIGADYETHYVPMPMKKLLSHPPIAPSQTSSCTSRFETGMVFPRWTQAGYGPKDSAFASSLGAITVQTRACWLEMPILFKMKTADALTLDTSSAPTVQNFTQGLASAKAYGFHVFVVPLVDVSIPGGWAGNVQFSTKPGVATWFNALWNAYRPYVVAAEQGGADQLSIGTELEWMQRNAPDNLWQQYITRVKSVYQGKILYDTNWSDISDSIPAWMRSLDTIGVSTYFPLVSSPVRVAPQDMTALFSSQVETKLDGFAQRLNRPILVSELGYRNSSDALYQPWSRTSQAGTDSQEQAGAIKAALSCLTHDSHIYGVFLWAWQDSGPFDLKDSQATTVIHQAYAPLGE